MQPRVLRSLVLLLLLNVLIKPLWLLGIDREVQNLNGAAAYGIYYALFNLSLYLQILLDPGIHTWNNKTIAQDQETLSDMLSRLLPLKAVLALAYLAATLVLGFVLGYGGHAFQMLLLIAVIQILQSFLLYMRTAISGLQHFNADAIFSVLDRGLMIAVCGAILWTSWFGLRLNIFQFIYAQIAVSAIALAAASIVVFRQVKFFRPRIQFSSFASVFRSSWPFALLGLLMTLYSRIDTMMLERMHPDGARQAGIYASAYRLLEAANMIAYLFAGILLPLLANMFARKENVMPTANLFYRLLMVPSLLLVLGCSVYREPVMYVLYDEADAYSAQVFSYLIPSFLAWGTVYIYGSLLTAHGSLRFLNISSAAGLVINIVLNFLLIPKYGAKGAAATALVTQSIVGLAQYVRAHLLFPYSVPPADTLRWAAFVMVSVCSFILFHDAFADWKAGFALLTLSNLIFAVAIGLLKPRYFLQLIKFNA